MAFSKQQLERLWVQAGGDPAKAGEAAAVAMAESSGRPDAVNRNTNGSIDRGLWQINSIHGTKSTLDPLANARAAVAISGNGRSFRPWVAFNTGAYRKFLGGGGARGASQAPSGPSRGRPGGRATTTTVGAVDNSRARGQAIASFLLNKSDTPLDLAVQLKGLADVPGQKVTVRPQQRGGATSSTQTSGHGKLLELFYQGPGGLDVKNGVKEPLGFVSGHRDHVHVAAGPKEVVRLGRLAQKMGLHVGENPHFGGVDPVHVKTSYHYRGQAIDVSGPPDLMRKFARKVAAMHGVR